MTSNFFIHNKSSHVILPLKKFHVVLKFGKNHIETDLEGKRWEGERAYLSNKKKKSRRVDFQFSHVPCLDETIKDGKPPTLISHLNNKA